MDAKTLLLIGVLAAVVAGALLIASIAPGARWILGTWEGSSPGTETRVGRSVDVVSHDVWPSFFTADHDYDLRIDFIPDGESRFIAKVKVVQHGDPRIRMDPLPAADVATESVTAEVGDRVWVFSFGGSTDSAAPFPADTWIEGDAVLVEGQVEIPHGALPAAKMTLHLALTRKGNELRGSGSLTRVNLENGREIQVVAADGTSSPEESTQFFREIVLRHTAT
ncbi:MAG: hypothetical protein NTX23_09615 [Candidatus Bipolaricaulota bacterium]|nr:hypothetical protein [Candidatus Bipolaricaulota bacterium]